MADLPILFSAPMVRALLREIEQPGSGKTQTRRVIKAQPRGPLKEGDRVYPAIPGMYQVGDTIWPIDHHTNVVSNKPGPHPDWVTEHVKIAVDDRLYVREAWCSDTRNDGIKPSEIATTEPIWFSADGAGFNITDWSIRSSKNRPGMFLPRWASRITLIVTDVRVQRLQEISSGDAAAEGVEHDSDGWRDYQMPGTQCCANARASFRTLWDSLNADRGYGWEANPWICAITFEPKRGNIDAL